MNQDHKVPTDETLTRLMQLAKQSEKSSLSDTDYKLLTNALSSDTDDATNEILKLLEGVKHLNLRRKLSRDPTLLERQIDRLSHVLQKNNSIIILDLSDNDFSFKWHDSGDVDRSLKNLMNVLHQDSCSIQALILSNCGLDDISVFFQSTEKKSKLKLLDIRNHFLDFNKIPKLLIQYPYLESLHIEIDTRSGGDTDKFFSMEETVLKNFLELLENNKTLKSIFLGDVFVLQLPSSPSFTEQLINVMRNNFSLTSIDYTVNSSIKEDPQKPKLQALFQRNHVNQLGKRALIDGLLTEIPMVIYPIIREYHGSFFSAETSPSINPIIEVLETYHLNNKNKQIQDYNSGLKVEIEKISNQYSDHVPILLPAVNYLRQSNDIVKRLNTREGWLGLWLEEKDSLDYNLVLKTLVDHLVRFAPINSLLKVHLSDSKVYLSVEPGIGSRIIIKAVARQLTDGDYPLLNNTGTKCKNVDEAILSHKNGELYLAMTRQTYDKLSLRGYTESQVSQLSAPLPAPLPVAKQAVSR